MKKSRNGTYKKSINQQQGYRNFIMNSSDPLDSTIPNTSEMLTGSAQVDPDPYKIQKEVLKIKKAPIQYKIIDFLKKNIFPAIITAIIIAIGTAVINHAISIAVINQKIDDISVEVGNLQEDSVSKETLALRLDNIKKDLNSDYSITLNDIKWKIKEIEDTLNKK